MKNINDINGEGFKYNGIYRALVVANEDPRDIGRVKVHVIGVYPDDMEIGLYPWAKPAVSPYNSGGANKVEPNAITGNGSTINYEESTFDKHINDTGTGGIFTVPNKGSTVFVWFDQGNHMYPYYFAMEAKEDDWLQQKENIKGKINEKVEKITEFTKKFVPEHGAKGTEGTDWADGAYINSRQKITSKGETIGGNTASVDLGSERIKEGNYKPTKVNHSNADKDGSNSFNMKEVKERARTNQPSLDIKPIFDKEDGAIERKVVKDETEIDYDKNPHVYSSTWNEDEVVDNERNVNRYVTSIMTEAGTTILIDNRHGQENYYFIHKGYMQNIDQHGSVKEYVGTNDVDGDTERCDKELGVEGDNKIHVLGNFVTYVKGNKLTQVDKNLQIDVNDSCGIRMKKGDFDIVLNGDKSSDRDDNQNSDRETGKDRQFGDLNIDIQNGNMDVHVKDNCNIHTEGNVNLKVDGDMKQTIKGSLYLDVEKDFETKVGGNIKLSCGGDVIENVSGKQKQQIGGGLYITSTTDITGETKIKGKLSVSSDTQIGSNLSVGSNINFGGSLSGGGCSMAGGDVSTSSGVSLLGHQHPFSWFWSHGGGSSNSFTSSGLGSSSANITAPTKPSPPSSGENDGSDPKIATREHEDRGSKT